MTSQYSSKLPMALPIAWAYSHMMCGLPAVCPLIAKPSPPPSPWMEAFPFSTLPSLPRFSSHSTDGYMVESTSASALPRSQWRRRVASSARTSFSASRKPSPWPVSLPIDHMKIAAWLR